MAEGNQYSLRKSTLDTRLEREKDEERRIRKRLEEIERKKQRETELQRLILQREKIIKERQRTGSGHDKSFITVDDLESTRFDDIDLSKETRALDTKLLELEITEHEHERENTLRHKPVSQLEKSLQRLEQNVSFVDTSTLRHLDRDKHIPKKPAFSFVGSERKQLSKELTSKEEELIEREKRLEEREARMSLCEEKIDDIQKKMDARFNEMEESFKEKENNLMQYRKQIDEENEIRRQSLDEIERRLLERRCKSERNPQDIHEEEKSVGKDYHYEDLNIKLNFSPFSGRDPVPKHESSFEEFKLEFESVRHMYSEQVLRRALMKSLKEQARKTMMHLGTETSVDDIIKRLEENFGNVASGDSILSRFLLAEQLADESIVEWSLRLEEMLLQVCRTSKMDGREKNLKLRNRFWRGLRSDELKQATRACFDSSMTYEELRNKVRSEEFEIKLLKERSGTKTKTGKLNQTSAEVHSSQTEDMMMKLMKQVQELDRKLEDMKINQEEKKEEYTENKPQRGGYRGSRAGGYKGFGRGRQGQNTDKQPIGQQEDEEHLNA